MTDRTCTHPLNGVFAQLCQECVGALVAEVERLRRWQSDAAWWIRDKLADMPHGCVEAKRLLAEIDRLLDGAAQD